MPCAGGSQRGRDRDMRWPRHRARTEDRRVGNNAIRIWRERSIYGQDCVGEEEEEEEEEEEGS